MPARAKDNPLHELGIWLPIALADIFTTLVATSGVKNVPTVVETLNGWQLSGLAQALAAPTETKPHMLGGEYGSELAAMFMKDLV